MLFKSQIGQDKWVCEMLHYKRDGFFLDIGAFDGEQISNTHYLEKELGWNGICIEAGKNNFLQLIKNRGCLCLNNAMWSRECELLFKEDWTVGKVGEGEITQAISFKSLFREWDIPLLIDYISLDIEGAEYEALRNFPFGKYKVRIWTIEHNCVPELRDKIRSLMTDHGYTMIEKAFEDWWYDNELTS
jgi:hypothetical protein